MAGEGSIEYQDLEEILDNFAKGQEEKENKNVPATTNVALSIWDNIFMLWIDGCGVFRY